MKTKIHITGCVVAALFLLTLPARADLVLLATNSGATQGDTGDTLEVGLTNNGPSDVTIGGFSFGISVPSTSGITFTDVTTNTATPYIFAGTSLFGPDITNPGQTLPATDITASDITENPSGIDVASGSTVGLGLVFFSVAANAAPTSVSVNFDDYPVSSLSDENGNNVSIDTFEGSAILVAPSTAAVPEPSAAAALAGLVLAAGTFVRHRRAC